MRSPLITPMLPMLVQTALTTLDDVVFDTREACPLCGGSLVGYDTRRKQFAVLIDGEKRRMVSVRIVRFRCRSCNKICNADEPFYPNTRIGSPVIDLCIAFSRAAGYGKAARILSAMGISMDRMRCRHYAGLSVGTVTVVPVFGFPVPRSILSLSTLTASTSEGGRIIGAEALAACGFPSAYRAPADALLSSKEGNEWDKQK